MPYAQQFLCNNIYELSTPANSRMAQFSSSLILKERIRRNIYNLFTDKSCFNYSTVRSFSVVNYDALDIITCPAHNLLLYLSHPPS